MRVRASSALSIPVALRAAVLVFDAGSEEVSSSWERSRPALRLVFLAAVLAPAFLGFEGASRSSAARRASFSAFLAAAAAFLASDSSLLIEQSLLVCLVEQVVKFNEKETFFRKIGRSRTF